MLSQPLPSASFSVVDMAYLSVALRA
jgi:hypothetical protein